ncbi:MAG TPA: TonB-dependent receptor [Rhizomicrobium sp.]|nr:TonB-dependent receptor [Rhizomicrobium sp.]
MKRKNSILQKGLMASASWLFAGTALAFAAHAGTFNIPGGTLSSALDAYSAQSGIQLAVSSDLLQGARSKGVTGEMSSEQALSRLLTGTGLTARTVGGSIAIVRAPSAEHSENATEQLANFQLAQATPPRANVETVTVTSSKLGGADVQSIPIAITALSQEQLTATQTAGGPDLVKQVPNLTFTKTNFSGYSIQIRGIGTQAISVTTDPAVAVALNDIPFIRNHFFEQEFFDLSQAEVLRGPQGTLYGRNATAGVVNLITAKPTDQFEAMASGDIGNYKNRRFEGMINLPLVDDRLDLRVAGEWTKRNGYTTNDLTGDPVDGRDLWSGRATLTLKPTESLQATLLWEHFQENDDRLRSSKQLCKTAPSPTEVGGVPVPAQPASPVAYSAPLYLSQGCEAVSLYDKGNPAAGDYGAFGVPNGISLPYYEPLAYEGTPVMAGVFFFDPYASTSQSTNLRVIESTINPQYKANNDTLELNVDYTVTPSLTFSSQTGYNRDFLWSAEDYNRFNTRPGAFVADGKLNSTSPLDPNNGICNQAFSSLGCTAPYQPCTGASANTSAICVGVGTFCDPQLGCSDRLVAEDLNDEHSWQLSQEFRLASNFSGPFNFSVGGNYLHYETEENYYVFINSLTLASYTWARPFVGGIDQNQPWVPGVSDNLNCIPGGASLVNLSDPDNTHLATEGQLRCQYIDPNPLTSLNNEGHNYYLNQNPYTLNSYAGFGEAYYNVTHDLKLTGGLRWTDDRKHFVDIPSELFVPGYGYPITGIVDQSWQEFTGRFAANWTPKLDFTDQSLFYASFAHGYKAGGANPPSAQLLSWLGSFVPTPNPIHPLTFKPEFINAFELGTKNTLLDGSITFNGNVFYYDYKGYQISRIVDRTAINDNFDATVKGAEIEATYEPTPGLRLKFAGGYEDTRVANGQSSVDLMDRADVANHPDWMVVKPFVSQASNCILPVYVVAALLTARPPQGTTNGPTSFAGVCSNAYQGNLDPVTDYPYKTDGPPVWPNDYYQVDSSTNSAQHDPVGYPGFNPATAPNNGQGFAKDLSGNELPNAPPLTVSASADYTVPITANWAGTLHADYYWQDYSWARIFNDNPYDRLRGYTNVNLALILTNQDGWQVMGYLKNVFNTTAITGDFLNSDDSGLTTNVFLTDPRLFGVRVTKNW